ncbi:MAG: glucoamylase family protein [Bacteroidota bacterium]
MIRCKKYITLFASVFVIQFSGISQVVNKQSSSTNVYKATRVSNLSDTALLEIVQKQTFKYFWDFAHPVSGMARERSNITSAYGLETVTTGGTGFGVMSIIVAAERKWITRDTAVGRLLRMIKFLSKADSYHGLFPHWLNGGTGKTIPFSRKDDGADVVETSYLFEGLLCAREYFNKENKKENELRNRINWLWNEVEWNFQTQDKEELFWHWSPNNGWSMNLSIHGWNECFVTFLMAASSPRYSIDSTVYHSGWTNGKDFKNGKKFYDIELPLGPDYGGPLFFSQYSFMAIDPHGLKDRYADYWHQNLNHTLINYNYCVDNPKDFKGYGENCWGLTSSDSYNGYDGHSPTNDLGVISPTAALSAFPYTPDKSMKALKHFYYDHGDKIWGQYGFVDAFNETKNWTARSYLAIDQGPIIVMIENYRTGLLWKLFMNCKEIQTGLKKLNIESPYLKEVK